MTAERRGRTGPRSHLGVGSRPVWYVAYGSNLLAARFACYIGGGRPAGARRDYPGCRDRTPPLKVASVQVPGGLYFADTSLTWGGGMAFLDPHLPGYAAARAYLVTTGQLVDVAAQEMRRLPGESTDLDLDDPVLVEALAHGSHALGVGRYETLLPVGERDGHPMLTLTAPWRSDEVATAAPSAAYLGVIAAGLAEAHGWSPAWIGAYLAAAPGARGAWTAERVAALVSAQA